MDYNWAVTKALLWKVQELVPVGGTILELGSGYSTQYFVEQGYKTYSVENDEIWLNKVPGAHYIHAPIVPWGKKNPLPKSVAKRFPETKGWYDPEILKAQLPTEYDLILVDGPLAEYGRVGFLVYLDLFRKDVPIILDDMHRFYDIFMARWVAEKLEKDLVITNNKSLYKPFGIIK